MFKGASLLLILFMGISNAAHPLKSIPKHYVKLSAEDKRDWIWNEGILATEFQNLPRFENVKILKLLTMPLKKKMLHEYDFRPQKWTKPIHRRSVVAKIKFLPHLSSPFSGMYSTQTIGLIRLSLTYTPYKKGVAPGVALKLFVDGKKSIDASFLTGLDSHGQNYNFFSKAFTNIVPKAKKIGGKLVSLIFKRAAKKTTYIDVKHLAQIKQNGTEERNINAPQQIFLVAPRELQTQSLPARDIRKDLMNIPPGSILFKIYAQLEQSYNNIRNITEKKNKENLTKSKLIGHIVLESPFIASSFGDDQLFFRHQKFQIH
ncbi:MAG: hypothetical protein N4A33_05715 [Bacteriovoracaceae bacterium]|jgi:TusA-related sulfurtransferase|nr:hypothetical protein [Bacteriovoracaceae bacterium]